MMLQQRTSSLLSRYFCKTMKLYDLVAGSLSLQPLPNIQELLNTVIIAVKHDVNFLPDNYILDSLFNIEDILHRCIEFMCKRNRLNVLARGYTFIREGYKRSCIRGSNCIQMKAPNTVVTYLKTMSWSKIHKLIGDDVMFHLLMNTSMFLSVECNCYVQLCGVPLMDFQTNELSCFKDGKCAYNQRQNHSKITKTNKGITQQRKKRVHVHDRNEACLYHPSRKPKRDDNNEKCLDYPTNPNNSKKGLDNSCKKRKRAKANSEEGIDQPHKKRKVVKDAFHNNFGRAQVSDPPHKNPKCRKPKKCSGVVSTSSKIRRRSILGGHSKALSSTLKERKSTTHISSNGEKRWRKKNGKEKESGERSINYLQRSRMFYSTSFKEGFHRKFILNTIPVSNSGVYTLLNAIFQFKQVETKHKRIPKQFRGLQTFLKVMITNFKRLKLSKILNFYCPVPTWTRTLPRKWVRKCTKDSTMQNKARYRFAVRSFTSVQQVFLFVRYIIKKVFPPLIWGSERNQNIIIKAVKRLLSLDRYERLSTGNVMSGIKVSHFAWLNYRQSESKQKPLQQSQKQNLIIQTFITWVFNRFIVPLLRGCFYVTESHCHKNKVFFYRKPIWCIIRGLGLQALLGNLYKPIHRKGVDRKLKNNETKGVHRIRLIPGQKKLRPISNMTNCSMSTSMKGRRFSINDELKAIHLALQYEVHINSKILGVSVSSSEQIYEKWKAFVAKCKQTHPTSLPKMFFISLDISRCFDTLPQDQLLELIPNCLQEETYQIRKFVKIKVGHGGSIRKKYVSMATEGTDCTHFVSFIRKSLQCGRIVARNTVFVDKVFYVQETREHLLALLRKHIKCSIGYIGNRFLIQETGVPQGSILATTLNNIHYGNIESKNLVPLFHTSSDSVFMRWVDDYFFVTTCKMKACKFLEALHTKMPKYGCKINTKKTLLNFEISSGHGTDQRFSCIKGVWFPWCGYLFNCNTLECSVNYVQYIGERIQDGITFENASHPGLSMARKLILVVCFKAVPLIADCTINSVTTVHKNIYQVFRFAALKFLCHSKVLRKGRPITPHLPFYCKLLKKMPLKFWKVMRNRMRKSTELQNNVASNKRGHIAKVAAGGAEENTLVENRNRTIKRKASTDWKHRFPISLRTVEVLCYQAFVDALRTRKSVYGKLLEYLIHELRAFNEVSRDINFDEIRKHSKFLEMAF